MLSEGYGEACCADTPSSLSACFSGATFLPSRRCVLDAGGNLVVMSYHIHYNTVASDQERFYQAFIKEFQSLFNPAQYPGFEANQCPFGPNFGSNAFQYVCSLEGPYQEHSVGVDALGGSPWAGPQRAFFIPAAHIGATWAWAVTGGAAAAEEERGPQVRSARAARRGTCPL